MTKRQKPEEWRPVWLDRGLTNYEVSSHGRVRHAVTKRIKSQHYAGTPKRVTAIVMIYSPMAGAARMVTVHGLVARAFLGDPPSSDMQVEHKDQNRKNNHADNLCYTTQSLNILRSYAHGTRKRAQIVNRGLSEASHDLVRELWETRLYSQVEIGKVLGISNSTVSRILSGDIKPRPHGKTHLIPDWSQIPGGCRCGRNGSIGGQQ